MEINQKNIIKKLDKFNKVFDEEIEKALKNSVFEYKIINIFVVEKVDDKYQSEKAKCSNIDVKILFHGTKIEAITGILSTQFRDANQHHKFGIGVYLTDQLDYAWYYTGEDYRGNLYNIPKVGDSFSIVASEIYYNQSKKKIVYNCKTTNEKVDKYGIRYTYVDHKCLILQKSQIEKYDGFIGNEFLITDKNQILPLYAVTLKRVEYLIIWRDYNFDQKNLNKYRLKLLIKCKNFIEK